MQEAINEQGIIRNFFYDLADYLYRDIEYGFCYSSEEVNIRFKVLNKEYRIREDFSRKEYRELIGYLLHPMAKAEIVKALISILAKDEGTKSEIYRIAEKIFSNKSPEEMSYTTEEVSLMRQIAYAVFLKTEFRNRVDELVSEIGKRKHEKEAFGAIKQLILNIPAVYVLTFGVDYIPWEERKNLTTILLIEKEASLKRIMEKASQYYRPELINAIIETAHFIAINWHKMPRQAKKYVYEKIIKEE